MGEAQFEKLEKGLECHVMPGCCGAECPYKLRIGTTNDDEPTCSEQLCRDALALIRQQQERIAELEAAQSARVMTARELATYCGAAWAEVWFYDDGETEESKELYPVAVCCGHMVTADGSITPAGRTFEILNRPYGLRLWTDKPTPEQQEEAWQ